MTNSEKALLFRAVSLTALLVALYGGGLALLILGIVRLPWLIGKIACALLLVWGVGRAVAAYYTTR
jgi:hypothetical protein